MLTSRRSIRASRKRKLASFYEVTTGSAISTAQALADNPPTPHSDNLKFFNDNLVLQYAPFPLLICPSCLSRRCSLLTSFAEGHFSTSATCHRDTFHHSPSQHPTTRARMPLMPRLRNSQTVDQVSYTHPRHHFRYQRGLPRRGLRCQTRRALPRQILCPPPPHPQHRTRLSRRCGPIMEAHHQLWALRTAHIIPSQMTCRNMDRLLLTAQATRTASKAVARDYLEEK